MAKNQVSKVFENKKLSLLISLLLAIAFWFTITIIENPESERVINGIQVYLGTEGTIVAEQGLSIVNQDESNQYASIKISGARYVVNSISPEDILVNPSFEDINAAGKYSVKLNAINNSTKNFVIESVIPEKIDIELDYIDTVSYDVQIKVKGATAAKGLSLGIERFTNTQEARLEVSGPRSIVSTIDSVYAEATANKKEKLSATKSFNADIVLYDIDGKKISTDNLELSFETISVSVPVLKSKTVPIRCAYSNKPQEYTPIATITSNGKALSQIKIEGSPDIVDQTDFVELESIDFSTISRKNNTFVKGLVLPSGVSTVDEISGVKVKLQTSNIKSARFNIKSAVGINNNDNLKINLLQPISTVVCGEKNVIDALNDSNLYAEIDLDGKVVGEQSVTVRIKSRVKDNVWQFGNYEAKISVTK